MRIIVSDSNCLIDLRKASLLEAFLSLPYEILIPNTLFEEELLKFSDKQKKGLIRGGLKVVDLPGEAVLRARQLAFDLPHLSIHDSFAFALAESCPGCILLTGDSRLREIAEAHDMEVHGVLWVIDEIHVNGLVTSRELLIVLRRFAEDPTVWLPHQDLLIRMRRFKRKE